MMTTTMVMMPVVLLFAVAACEIAFETAFVIASLPQRLNCALVYASTHRMDSVRLDVDKKHVSAMHLCCAKHVNKHYMHTYYELHNNENSETF